MEWTEAKPGSPETNLDRVQVWRFPLAGPYSDGASTILTNEELDRANGMSSPKAAQSFVAGQSTLRAILSAYTATHPRDVEMERGPHGKPMLRDASANVHFNVSHSGLWGLIAVARFPVGVDVEQVRHRRATAALARRFMTQGERDLLRQREERHGPAAFFILWSRKEAYLKATGFGLSAPFSRIDSAGERLPDLDETGNQVTGPTPWSIMDFFVDDHHAAAIVARTAQISPSFFTFRRSNR